MKPYIVCAFAALAWMGASACGTVATPEWAAEAQATRVAQVATDEQLTAIAPTATPTNTLTPTPPPTATPLPPTATPLPTETPTPLPPTAAPLPPTADPAAADPIAAALAAGDPANGQALFVAQHTLPDNTAWACASCHSVDASGVRLIGPGLWNVTNRPYLPETSLSAPEYVRNSILHPQDYVAPPLDPSGAAWALNMPLGWDVVFSEQQLNDLVAYLMTLRG